MEREVADLESVATPCLLVDRERVERNTLAMRTALGRHGVPLRQHVKTAKSVDVARLVAGASHAPIAVSTLREAEHFAEAGFVDQTLAVGTPPTRAPRIAALLRAGVRLRALVDDGESAQQLAQAVRALDARLELLIEIDVGQHRGGVAPDGATLLEVATAIDRGGGRLVGVLAHGGHAYDARGAAAIARVAEQERSLAVHAAERLRAHGHATEVVSVGSTPTALFAERLDGVTEVRAGVFVFQDLFQAALGCARVDDIALSVLTTVIGVHRERGAVLVDAGALALSKDRSLDAGLGGGFGEVCALDGSRLPGRPTIEWVNQEHGKLDLSALPSAPKVGDRLRILPNHACLTAAMYDRYGVVRGASGVTEYWARVNGY